MSYDIIIKVLTKELKEVLGDKRAVFISLLFPIILFPIIFGLMEKTPLLSGSPDHSFIYIGISNADTEGQNPGEIADEEKTAIGRAALFLEEKAGFTVIKSSSPGSMLASGDVHLVISYTDGKFILLSDNSRQASLTAAAAVGNSLLDYLNYLENSPAGTEEKRTPPPAEFSYLYSPEKGAGLLTLSTLLPMLLLVFSAISPAAVAADLGAGEKERQTLEPLLSNPVSRADILTGKLLTLSIMGTAGTISFLTGLALAWKINPELFGPEEMVFSISISSVFFIFIFTLILALIFSSLELALSIYAGSAKEAQILFLPVFLLSTAAGYSVSATDPGNIDFFYRHLPLVNISVLIKELSLGIFSLPEMVITLFWSTLYVLLSFFAALYLFKNEKVIFRS